MSNVFILVTVSSQIENLFTDPYAGEGKDLSKVAVDILRIVKDIDCKATRSVLLSAAQTLVLGAHKSGLMWRQDEARTAHAIVSQYLKHLQDEK